MPSNRTRSASKAVIFDMDGVLFDTFPAYLRAWRNWAAAYGVSFSDVAAVARGRRPTETIRTLLGLTGEELRAARQGFQTGLNESSSEAQLMGGAQDLLGSLPRASWAVATSASRETATSLFERASVRLPRVLVSGDDVDQGKPSPDCYLLAAHLLRRRPERCLVVEDSPAGVRAARSAGMRVLGLATTVEPGFLLEADEVYPDLRTATPAIQNWL